MWGSNWHNGMMGQYGDGWFWPMFGLHGIGNLLFIALLIFGIVALFRHTRRTEPTHTALDALNARYANGDIDETTYRKIKNDLNS